MKLGSKSMHQVRQNIRKIVTSCLKKRFKKVFNSKAYITNLDEEPTITVSTNKESFKLKTLFPAYYNCYLELSIEAVKNESENLEDELDQISTTINELISQDKDLKEWADRVDLKSIETDFDSESDEFIGGIRLNYIVSYSQENPQHETYPHINFTGADLAI